MTFTRPRELDTETTKTQQAPSPFVKPLVFDSPTFSPPSIPSSFTAPQALVTAYSLAARYRAKALSLGWEDDDKVNEYLRRARELETGDLAEVPDEDI